MQEPGFSARRRAILFDDEPKNLYVEPEDGGSDPELYSKTKLIPPFSFVDQKVLIDNPAALAPPPTYQNYDFIKQKTSTHKSLQNEGMLVMENGGLKCVNHEALDRQKGAVKDLLTTAAATIFTGQSIVGVSLPVRIFDSQSLFERLTEWYGHAPNFLKKAALQDDKVERMKLSIAFAITSLYWATKQLKPFNPILGETYQASFEEGTKVYWEHTSHHPPIANVLMEDADDQYKFSGFYAIKANVNKNTLIVKNEGQSSIEFKRGQKITYQYPFKRIGGVLWGDRTVNIDGTMIFEDKENGLKAVLIFRHKKQDQFIGKLYRYDPSLQLQKDLPTKLSEIKDI